MAQAKYEVEVDLDESVPVRLGAIVDVSASLERAVSDRDALRAELALVTTALEAMRAEVLAAEQARIEGGVWWWAVVVLARAGVGFEAFEAFVAPDGFVRVQKPGEDWSWGQPIAWFAVSP